MTESERSELLAELDCTLLKGGVVLSGWCMLIVQEADNAFTKGAMLASLLTAMSGVETYLRSEYGNDNKETLFNLINKAPIDEQLKKDLHTIRNYRNNWVHVEEPWRDRELERNPELLMAELEEMALFAVIALRRTIYENQWV